MAAQAFSFTAVAWDFVYFEARLSKVATHLSGGGKRGKSCVWVAQDSRCLQYFRGPHSRIAGGGETVQVPGVKHGLLVAGQFRQGHGDIFPPQVQAHPALVQQHPVLSGQ